MTAKRNIYKELTTGLTYITIQRALLVAIFTSLLIAVVR